MPRRLALLILSLIAAPVCAEDWYEVELIVFRHINPSAGNTESWPLDPGRPTVETALELVEQDGGALLPLTRLGTEPRRLAGTWDALKRSPRYEPLGHWSWLQPGYERGSEPAVHLALGPLAERAGPADASGFPVLGDAVDAPPPLPPLRRPLDGTLSLGLQRYLYARLDLVFRPDDAQPALVQRPRAAVLGEPTDKAAPVMDDGAPAPEFLGWRLTETRRLRSREVQYFDHPLFGAILLVTPRPMPDIPPPAPSR
jgi:hypothetical protein